MTTRKMLLAGDVGGTKTSLIIYTREAGPRNPVAAETFASNAFGDLESVARTFLKKHGVTVSGACFGIAGPVRGDRVETTNLPWRIEARRVAAALDIPKVFLINDLAATANAVPYLGQDNLKDLHSGTVDPKGAMVVIAPGTGLGEAILFPSGAGWRVQPSEGGHADFAPLNKTQDALLSSLRRHLDHVSYEHVCSGMGIANIYRFFKEGSIHAEPEWLAAEIGAAPDPTPVIVAGAMEPAKINPLCTATVETFVEILAAEAGNLFLKVLASGGVYLGGGIPPRILDFLKMPRFLEIFREKGRMEPLLADVPVRVIVNSGAALLGAAHYGLDAEDQYGQ